MRRRQAFAERSDFMNLARKAYGPETRFEDMNDEFLMDCYYEKFGRMPHGRMKRETMLDRLNDARHVSA